MKQIIQFIWNAPAWVIIVPICIVVGMVGLGIYRINRGRQEAMSEFHQRREEMRERMDRGARRTGTGG